MRLLHLVFLIAVTAGISLPSTVGVPVMSTELERGLALASVAATEMSVFYSQAETVYEQAKTLLPRINGLDRTQKSRLDQKLRDLRLALDLVPGARDRGFRRRGWKG